MKRLTYRESGVDLEANEVLVARIAPLLRRTHDLRVLRREAAGTGLFQSDFVGQLLRRDYRDPVLVAGADGVGSKVLLAAEWDRLDGIGQDLVAMSVNDVLRSGAEPLFFLDYIACHKLDPDRLARVIAGMADACLQADCALLGGETAEMPDMYGPSQMDLAGFCVGVVERDRIIDGSAVEPDDVVIGLASSGLHANGFTLVRRLLKQAGQRPPDAKNLGEPLADALLRPTRIYVRPILQLLRQYRRKRVIRALAHITGGGLERNLARVLPPTCDVWLRYGSWPVPPVFGWLRRQGVDHREMRRVFNMGIGYALILRPAFADSVIRRLRRMGEQTYKIGTVRPGEGRVTWKKE